MGFIWLNLTLLWGLWASLSAGFYKERKEAENDDWKHYTIALDTSTSLKSLASDIVQTWSESSYFIFVYFFHLPIVVLNANFLHLRCCICIISLIIFFHFWFWDMWMDWPQFEILVDAYCKFEEKETRINFKNV